MEVLHNGLSNIQTKQIMETENECHLFAVLPVINFFLSLNYT